MILPPISVETRAKSTGKWKLGEATYLCFSVSVCVCVCVCGCVATWLQQTTYLTWHRLIERHLARVARILPLRPGCWRFLYRLGPPGRRRRRRRKRRRRERERHLAECLMSAVVDAGRMGAESQMNRFGPSSDSYATAPLLVISPVCSFAYEDGGGRGGVGFNRDLWSDLSFNQFKIIEDGFYLASWEEAVGDGTLFCFLFWFCRNDAGDARWKGREKFSEIKW